MKYCVIIPTFNNEKTLEGIISGTLEITKDVIVVNDGSTDSTEDILKKYSFLQIISYPKNKGKGYAIRKGFEKAISEGYDYAITIDSDGQHFPEDICKFIDKIGEEPGSLIVGDRNLKNESLSGGSSFANRFSNFWFKFLTGTQLNDTQTGYRLYPLKSLEDIKFFTRKYEFELEVLVRAAWRRVEITSIPVKVFYPSKEERVSHFRPFKDFARISILNTILVLVSLLYVKPFAFFRYLTRENIRDFVNKNILLSDYSNLQIAMAIALGIFMGIIPLWGFQLILAIGLAHVFGLSKLLTSVAANISIPPMIPFILYFSYVTGCLTLDHSINMSFSSTLEFNSFKDNLMTYIVGSIVLATVMSILSGIFSYVILKIFRKKRVTAQ
jgi:glycosyltransferase involved in cell wall biosynthesis